MHIDPEDRINSDTKLVLAIEDTKGWMGLALKRPNRADIATCAAHAEKMLLENYGLIVAKDRLSKPRD